MSVLNGCNKKIEYKFNITTVDDKVIRLTRDNILEFKNHSTQNYFEQYSVNDIEKVGYLKRAFPYINKEFMTGNKEESIVNVFVIELNNRTRATFYLEESDNIDEVLRNSNSKISELDINKI